MLELRLLLVGLFYCFRALLLRLRGFRGRAVRGVALRGVFRVCAWRRFCLWRRARGWFRAERFGCVCGASFAAAELCRGFGFGLAAAAFGAPAAVAALRRCAEALRGGRRAPRRRAFLCELRHIPSYSVRAPVFDAVKYQNRRHDV